MDRIRKGRIPYAVDVSNHEAGEKTNLAGLLPLFSISAHVGERICTFGVKIQLTTNSLWTIVQKK
jgi:hypothetical protein